MTRQRRAGGGVDRLPSGRYRVRIITPDGRRLSLGTHPTKRAAETAYARTVTDQADGKPTSPSAVTTPTLADYAPAWVEARLSARGEPLRPRVRDLYLSQLRLHVLPTLGSARLARITTASVRAWYADLRGPSGPGASTAAKCYRLLRSILGTAVEDGLIPANPCTIKGAGIEPADERPIPTVAEALQLADAIHPRLRTAVFLAAFVGLRKGELLGLQRADLDLGDQEITIARQRQLDRHGPAALVDDLHAHLDAYAQPGADGYVFTGHKGGPLGPHVLQNAWAKARAEVGMPLLHLHDLRHLAGTLAASTGAGTKGSCTASATPRTKPPFATNTPHASATRRSPRPSTRSSTSIGSEITAPTCP